MAQQVQPEQTPEAWDPVAEGYERSSLKFSAYYAAEVCGLLGVKLGERVLDVAAGTGAFAVMAAQSGADVLAMWSAGIGELCQGKSGCCGFFALFIPSNLIILLTPPVWGALTVIRLSGRARLLNCMSC